MLWGMWIAWKQSTNPIKLCWAATPVASKQNLPPHVHPFTSTASFRYQEPTNLWRGWHIRCLYFGAAVGAQDCALYEDSTQTLISGQFDQRPFEACDSRPEWDGNWSHRRLGSYLLCDKKRPMYFPCSDPTDCRLIQSLDWVHGSI